MMSGCGRMILGSDSHTRYGALGTMAVGEGGGELAKQLVGRTYDMAYPGVVAIYLTGKPNPGVGPHDVALALVAATYANGYVKNKVMEFVGPGVANLSADYRNGIDVMTTETTCLVLHLADRRCDERIFRAAQSPRSLQRAETRRRGLLRRLHRAGPLHRRVHDCAAVAPQLMPTPSVS